MYETIEVESGGEDWLGAEMRKILWGDANLLKLDLGGDYKTVTMKVYTKVSSGFMLWLQNKFY